MILHWTNSVKIAMSDCRSIASVCGMVDKDNLLSLVRRDKWWDVSIQRNGFRLDWYRKKKDARTYMKYMLEHAADGLASIPTDYFDAIDFVHSSGLRETHCAARLSVSPDNTPGHGHGNQAR